MVMPKLLNTNTEESAINEALSVVFSINDIQKKIKDTRILLYRKTNNISKDSHTIEQLTKQFAQTKLSKQNFIMKDKITNFLSKFIFKKEISKINFLNNEVIVKFNVFGGIYQSEPFKKEVSNFYTNLKERILEQNDIKDKFGELSNSYLLCKVCHSILTDSAVDINKSIEKVVSLFELSNSFKHELDNSTMSENDEKLYIQISKFSESSSLKSTNKNMLTY